MEAVHPEWQFRRCVDPSRCGTGRRHSSRPLVGEDHPAPQRRLAKWKRVCHRRRRRWSVRINQSSHEISILFFSLANEAQRSSVYGSGVSATRWQSVEKKKMEKRRIESVINQNASGERLREDAFFSPSSSSSLRDGRKTLSFHLL